MLGTFARRALTIPMYLSLALLSVFSAPLWVPLLALVDARRPGKKAALRCGAFFSYYLLCEAAGIFAAASVWLGFVLWPGASRERYLAWNFRLECWWGSSLLQGSARIFGFRIETEGESALEETPYLLFIRHASVADTLLAAHYASTRHGTRLRYVLKREQRWDPCLDLVGGRLPNYFVDRNSSDPEREALAVGALAQDLGRDEGVLIYPEGTRFTEEKRTRVLTRLREGGNTELAARAERLRHVLPPRLGGPLALLEAAPGADVVVCAHRGFEGAGTFWDLWAGSLVNQRIRVRFWRVAAPEIPKEEEARGRWLLEQWSQVDDWIAKQDTQVEPGPDPDGATPCTGD